MGRRGVLIALFVSLALNVFIVGGLVGAGLTGMRLRPPPPESGRPRPPIMLALRALPPERREAWRGRNEAFAREHGPKLQDARRRSRAAYARFGEEPFPRDAVLAELKAARATEFEGRSDMDQRIVDFAASLPRDERARFGDALAHPPRELGRRGAGRGRRPALPDRD